MIDKRTFALLFLVALGACFAGNAFACSANEAKLQALRRGMTYQEATQVMGCDGTTLSRASLQSGEFSTVEWSGSELAGITRTQLDFQDGRLLSFTTARRAGL